MYLNTIFIKSELIRWITLVRWSDELETLKLRKARDGGIRTMYPLRKKAM